MARLPYAIERDEKHGEKAYDLYSRLLKDRIIFIGGEFDDDLADNVVAQLLFLEANDSNEDIYIYINSPGGSMYAMYAIYDTMQYVKPDIVTVGYGFVASAASFILAAGTKGKRNALPHTDIMIHELAAGFKGKAKDILNETKKIERWHHRFIKEMAELTGQSEETIETDTKLDKYMTAPEALEYGVIDAVHARREEE
jgi:ATP-dependent Clp protease protease subunit